MHPHAPDPRPARASTCPRPACGRLSEAGTGGWSICSGCGRSWPVDPTEIPGGTRDDLSAAALTVGQLRSFLHGPVTPAERAAARRRLDALAEQRRAPR